MTRTSRLRFGVGAVVLAVCFAATFGYAQEAPPRQKILVGVNRDFPPFEFTGADGKPTGFDIDIVRAAAKEVYLDVQFEQDSWNAIKQKLVDRKIELLAGMLYSKERERIAQFGAPYLTVEYSIFIRKGTDGIGSLDDLGAKKVLVEEGSQMHEHVKRLFIGQILPKKSEPDALNALAKGEGDAALVPLMAALSQIRSQHLENVEAVGGPLFPRELCFAAQKSDTVLISRLNTGLVIIRNNHTYDRIYRKWFGPDEQAEPLWRGFARYFALAMVGVGLALVIGTVWVLTLRRKVRAQTADLRASEEKYRMWVELASDGIFVTTGEAVVVAVNAAVCEMLGYSREELIGKSAEGIFEPEHLRQTPFAYGRVEDGKVLVIERVFLRKDGTTFLGEIHSTRLQSGLYQGIVRDITARREDEDRLKRSNEELEARVRERTRALQTAYDEMESFSYSVAHDLRTPLRAMNGYATIVQRDFAENLDDEAKNYLERIGSNAKRMGQLIDSLLAYARTSRTELKRRDVSVREVAEEAWRELLTVQESHGIELVFAEVPDAYADPMLLKLLFVNLFDNGIKFAREVEGAKIEVGFEKGAYYVRDNGIGFDPKYKAKLFRVFERLHSSADYQGTGVGLAIVKRVAEHHGGKVWAEGEIGIGATFWFTLPRA